MVAERRRVDRSGNGRHQSGPPVPCCTTNLTTYYKRRPRLYLSPPHNFLNSLSTSKVRSFILSNSHLPLEESLLTLSSVWCWLLNSVPR